MKLKEILSVCVSFHFILVNYFHETKKHLIFSFSEKSWDKCESLKPLFRSGTAKIPLTKHNLQAMHTTCSDTPNT